MGANELLELLAKESYISQEDMQRATRIAADTSQSPIDWLLREGIVNRKILGQASAEYFSVPFADLSIHQPTPDQVRSLEESIAREYNLIVYLNSPKGLVVASDDPQKAKDALPALKKSFPSSNIKFAFALTDEIKNLFRYYNKSLSARLQKIVDDGTKIAPNLITEIFEDAVENGTSDIHIEPSGDEFYIRFRIDGVLHEASVLHRVLFDNLINRIKVLANLRIDEHYEVQDGAIRYTTESGKVIDMRISITPAIEGETVVIRLLSSNVGVLNLDEIGLGSTNQDKLVEASKKPFGMILVVGPTGAGKTTTLYSVIKKLQSPHVNITTIEDPVEYRVKGINQIQVNHAADITFAKGLRSIVRQDPDIILVGEIRDEETAEIAVNASLTGHLLLSTFHANDTATAIVRLIEMGVQPFLIASTLELIMSQRLVRRICLSCRVSLSDTKSVAGKRLYKGKGCEACNQTGYRGRSAIFELLPSTQQLREIIMKNPSREAILKYMETANIPRLRQDGERIVDEGLTTLEEIDRVIPLSDT